jgi:uncharacterized protein GlcG (DUF336 family)
MLLMTAAVASLAAQGVAQTPPPAPPAAQARPARPPRARGPALEPAVRAAEAAVAACAGAGYKVTALITDSAGDPVVLLSGDGVSVATQNTARTKVAAVLKYKMSSGDLLAKTRSDPNLAAEVKADPAIGILYQGAVPLISEGQTIGVFSVSGAQGGDKDEACVQAGLARHPQR